MVGWSKTINRNSAPLLTYQPVVSIILPVRNEAAVIQQSLAALAKQAYPTFEVWVVDDHSTDQTPDLVKQMMLTDSRFNVLTSRGEGKKAALTTGIEDAKGSIIVTTDADCVMNSNWLLCLVNSFGSKAVQFVFGGVRLVGTGFFSKLQTMEFSSLIGSGAATLYWGIPSMCNGANLAFRKSIFQEVGGYEGNTHIASGDDEFLMRKVFTRHPLGVVFAAHTDAVVSSSTQYTLSDFIRQRIRWAGKWSAHQQWSNSLLAVFIFASQLSNIMLVVVLMMGWGNSVSILLVLLIKMVVEFIFLRRVRAFLKASWSNAAFLALQVVYPLYVVAIGLLANVLHVSWKGRREPKKG